ncbi:tetratricopeptide repeat protein [Rummeliibacillus pycnus]|uniref:tetratricopeptide repeat protein n=1 Tax=Rummeliibacillus pycnus TaxID=101070 RepID=UPI000C9A3A4D|nr:tetratricopeptide repeat protein [Rummeliibacillus pycnus]
MNLQQLQQQLAENGYLTAAKLIPEIEAENNIIPTISQLFEDCQTSTIDFPDDIGILYTQVTSVSTYDPKYYDILLRDLQTILQEIIKPTADLATIFMEEEEVQEASVLYQKAMIAKADAQLELGKFYKAIGHDDWAFAWYDAAANQGNIDAKYWLGNYYYDGIVVEEDWEKTFECYKEAALKGHADAMNNYADMYFRGEYVEKDDKRAFELFSIAAELGVAESMYTLGYMFENGVGTEKDLAKSKYWFTQSALAGDVFAANRLGHEAFQNNRGDEAIRWYQMAADKQDVDGEFNLGFCYESGIGTPINSKKAKYWYQLAALQGDEEAKRKLKEL